MSLGKKLFIEGGDPPCHTDSVQPFGAESAYSSNVALYQLDGNANDTVGNHNGTASTSVYYSQPGIFGQCAVFNGSATTQIEIPDSNSFSPASNPITVSMWVKTTSTADYLASKAQYVSPSNKYEWGLSVDSSGNLKLECWTSAGSSHVVLTSSANINDGNWHHVAFSILHQSEYKLYADGLNVASTSSYSNTMSNTAANVYLGARGDTTNERYTGSIDQVRFFDRVLSDYEISILYNETVSTASDTNVLVEGSGLALYSLDYDASDASGNYNATAANVTFGVDGQINYGASFNGSSSKIELPSALSNGSTIAASCISFWFNVGAEVTSSTPNNEIMQFAGTSSLTGKIALGSTSGHMSGETFSVTHNVSGVYTYSTTNIPAGWNHAVVQWNSSDGKWDIYINSVKHTTYTVGTNAQGFFKLKFGNRSSAYYTGSLDQIRIFKKSLSQNEVDTLYTETACVYTSTTDIVGFPSSASSNLFAYYKLDNTGNDESANGHDGTQGSSMAYSFGRFGTGGSFDGSNNAVITIPDSNKFSPTVNDFSVSFWFNISSTSTQRMIAKGSNPYEWEIWVSNGQPVYVGYSPGGAGHGALYGGSNPGIYADGNWHHIVVTHDYGTKMEMFVDNVSIGSLTTFTGYGMGNTSSTVTIGKRGDQSTSMTGRLDQIRFYDKILTTDEIAELHNEKPETDTSNFNIALYTGIGNTQYISNVGFQPDLVWIKNRDNSFNHNLYFDIGGAINRLRSNTSGLSDTSGNLSSFEANGFILTGSNSNTNNNNNNYVAWCWKGGGDPVDNTNGNVTSQVSANQDAGFSIVKYTGSGSAMTVGHGLSSAPELIIFKSTNTTQDWLIATTVIDGSLDYWWDATAGFGTPSFNNLAWSVPDSSVINFGSSSTVINNLSGTQEMIAYCFHSVTGYQKIGIYTGNTTTPPTVNLGFQPRWILIKKTTTAASYNHWYILDAIRDTDGRLNKVLMPSLSNQEATYTNDYVDISSSGFTPNGGFNSNGVQHIYLAIA